jgi:hypothetical protein
MVLKALSKELPPPGKHESNYKALGFVGVHGMSLESVQSAVTKGYFEGTGGELFVFPSVMTSPIPGHRTFPTLWDAAYGTGYGVHAAHTYASRNGQYHAFLRRLRLTPASVDWDELPSDVHDLKIIQRIRESGLEGHTPGLVGHLAEFYRELVEQGHSLAEIVPAHEEAVRRTGLILVFGSELLQLPYRRGADFHPSIADTFDLVFLGQRIPFSALRMILPAQPSAAFGAAESAYFDSLRRELSP